MLFWLILAAMTGAAALILLAPLARARSAPDETSDDVAFYRAALADIDRDASRGLIGEAEAGAARTEAARRLLRSEAAASEREASSATIGRRRMIASLAAMVLVPAIALPIYLYAGSPHLADRPLAARPAGDPAQVTIAEAVARIEGHLSRNPNDGAGYEVLAPVYLRIGRSDDAARAFAQSLRINGESPERLANLGEALAAAAGGVVTGDAKQRLARALELDPTNAKARYYLALARDQDGDRAGAIAAFEELLSNAKPDATWLSSVRERLEELRGAPPGGDAIATLPADERMIAIRAMVDGLSQRLTAQGGSLDDWSRLVRSHVVLGEKDKASRALADARRALGAEASAMLDRLAQELGLQGS
ncbi:MAG: c-type cytochrome biogenesis protein CcmI [Beijerinckiaceae bacterium]